MAACMEYTYLRPCNSVSRTPLLCTQPQIFLWPFSLQGTWRTWMTGDILVVSQQVWYLSMNLQLLLLYRPCV